MTAIVRRPRRAITAVLLSLMVLCTPPAWADEDAYNWLSVMNHAVRELNYEGRFVYQSGDTLEAMYLIHTVDGDREHERLLSLNGKAREVIREQGVVVCRIRGEDGLVEEDARPAGRSFSPLPPIRPDQIESHYDFRLGGQTRVTGRPVQQVHIIPKDDLRYGYSLALDRVHGLPLRTLTVNAQGKPVSQVLFTDIRVGPEVHDTLAPIKLKPAENKVQSDVTADLMHPSHWRFENPPAGFTQVMRRYRHGDDGQDAVEHFVFSDGLASISVYAERHPTTTFIGWSRMGSVQAYGRAIGEYQVTAVGEVPKKTLSMLLEGMKIQED